MNRHREVGRFVRSLVGLGASAAGLIAVAGLTYEWRDGVRLGEPSIGILIGLTATFGSLACFTVVTGLRLLFNRPNGYGSIMGPFGWRFCASLIVLTCAGFIVMDARTGSRLSWRMFALLPIAAGCAVKARSLVKRG